MTIITQPSRLTFWRTFLAVTVLLPLLSVWQILGLTPKLGVDLSVSRSWMGLILALSLMSVLSLLVLALTWSRFRERILLFMEFPERAPEWARLVSALLLVISVVGFTIAFKLPFIELLRGIGWMRALVFWFFNILGLFALKSIRRDVPWLTAMIIVALCQSVFHLLLVYWPRVTDYPFSMGWSETSRFYHPSFFLSEMVYGRRYPWPIQNPSLHMLLAVPYLFAAPLWVHRFWQVALRYIFIAAVVPVLMTRLSIQGRAARWVVGLWMYLFLFMGPVYFHLTIPVILILLCFSPQNDRRTWFAILLASIWCGWSRVNWYPMPGILAAVLYLMEVPLQGKKPLQYLLKPVLWFTFGTLTAFLSQRAYIAFSGVADTRLFYTSFISDLLWYRLLPNASFSQGILPGIVIASLAAWIGIYILLRSRRGDWHPIRLVLIFGAILVLFLGGIVVSLKIGGGANLHNMDAYFTLLLIFFSYLVFARYRREDGNLPQFIPLHWVLAVALIINPALTFLQFGVDFKSYEEIRTQKIMASLQEHVDQVNAKGGEVLFINQRHLISMGMLKNVTLVWEYEREDLMEMAMSDNLPYLAQFRKDMEDQRFDLIIVDPLNYNVLGKNRSFAEENNVWVKRVMKHILCNYREEVVYPVHEVAMYVPQEGERHCP
jgi:hypothetical protein